MRPTRVRQEYGDLVGDVDRLLDRMGIECESLVLPGKEAEQILPELAARRHRQIRSRHPSPNRRAATDPRWSCMAAWAAAGSLAAILSAIRACSAKLE